MGRDMSGPVRDPTLRAGLLDELHLAVVPVLLGRDERLFEDFGSSMAGWTCVEFAPPASVTRVRLRPAASASIRPL
jgi:dihydrofolate reductase